MSVVATPSETSAAPAAQTDLRSEMISSLKSDVEATEKNEEAAETEEKVNPEQPSEKKVAKEDEGEEEPSDEGSDEEKTEKEDPDTDKPKKPNRYQRLKAKSEAAMALSQKLQNEYDEAIKIANLWRNRALANEQRLKQELERAKTTGYETSPLADENFHLQLKLREQELESQIAQKQAEMRAQREVEAEKQEMATQFQEQALSLAQTMGLQGANASKMAVKILRAYAAENSAGGEVSMQEIAQALAAVSQRQNSAAAVRAQLESNAGAPKPVRGRGGAAPDYPATNEGMAAFLRSLGQ